MSKTRDWLVSRPKFTGLFFDCRIYRYDDI